MLDDFPSPKVIDETWGEGRSLPSSGVEMRTNDLVPLLRDAFDRGNQGCYELRDQDIEDILADYTHRTTKVTRVAKSRNEIWCLKEDTRIFHPLFGTGFVKDNTHGRFGYVQFTNFRFELETDGWPWDVPTQVIDGG